MITRRAAPLLLLLTLSTCDEKDDEADGASACEPGDSPSSVTVDNRSGDHIERIVAAPCGGGAEQELSVSEGGIPFSEQATLELPGSGCWLLSWSGDGCGNETPYQTSTDVCAGETYEWTINVDGRVCEGGW